VGKETTSDECYWPGENGGTKRNVGKGLGSLRQKKLSMWIQFPRVNARLPQREGSSSRRVQRGGDPSISDEAVGGLGRFKVITISPGVKKGMDSQKLNLAGDTGGGRKGTREHPYESQGLGKGKPGHQGGVLSLE